MILFLIFFLIFFYKIFYLILRKIVSKASMTVSGQRANTYSENRLIYPLLVMFFLGLETKISYLGRFPGVYEPSTAKQF